MKRLRFLHFFLLIILSTLFVVSLPLTAMDQKAAISEIEKNIIDQNPDISYIYVDKRFSKIADLVSQLCGLDENNDSPLHRLDQHIKNGFSIAEKDAVIDALAYAESIINKNYDQLNHEYADQIAYDLNEIISKITVDEKITRASHVPSLIVDNSLYVDKWFHVRGKSQFDKHIRTKQGITADGHLTVGKSATFKTNALIEGVLSVSDTLSATDAIIENLTVTNCVDNLCVNHLSVNDANISNLTLDGALSFTTLSIVDQTVSGTLSVNDLVVTNCIDDLCVNNLSINDATISNLTLSGALSFTTLSVVDQTVSGTLSVNDLVVSNCINDLCVNNLSVVDSLMLSGALSFTNLSVVDQTVSGTLSVNDEVINTSLTITPFSTAGIVHNNASGVLSSSLIVNADVDPAAAIVDTKLATISTAGKVANSATTATSTNTANTIVERDASGNFSAGTITASLSGNATTATTATNFSGSLLGDITGTQGATVVSFVGGQTAANVAAATTQSSSATSANTASTVVKRDASGNFSAGAISVTDEVISTSLTITPFNTAGVVHNDASGVLSSSLIVNADVDPAAAIVDTKLATISTAGKVANSATTATSTNTANTIVERDASGNFSAGTITASLSGNATTATTATNFSGSLLGDVTGTQGATVVSFVGGQTAANVAAATTQSTSATSANTASTIVKRDASGNFSAGAISVTDEVISTSLTITPFNTAGVVHNDASGVLSSSLIVNADVDPAAGIVDTKLATISTAGKVANSATTATSVDTNNAIVARDGLGNFATNMITLDGTTTNATDAATKAYVDGQVAGGGTNLNTPNTNVKRDGTGSFAAQVVSVVDTVASGNLVLSADPSTSTTGNILKGANRFIHNFGTNNTFVGENAGNFTMSGVGSNVGLGTNALTANTTGEENTAIGPNALTANTTGFNNVAIGSSALQANTIAYENTAIGYHALFSNTTGYYNVGIGTYALLANTTGHENTAVGWKALLSNVTGNYNVAVGVNALVGSNGDNNIALGFGAGLDINGNNNIAIGNAGAALESDTIRIGSSQTGCFIAGIRGATTGNNDAIAVLIDSAGQLGTMSSSKRFKNNIQDMNEASENIFKLRPVTFAYNSDETSKKQFGLIAEEVETVFPLIVAHDEDGKPYTVQYHILPVLLLNEMKKQQQIIEEQSETMNDLCSTVEMMKNAIASLQTRMQEFDRKKTKTNRRSN